MKPYWVVVVTEPTGERSGAEFGFFMWPVVRLAVATANYICVSDGWPQRYKVERL